MPGISVAVMIVIGAFAIERISGTLLFLLSYVPQWNQFLPDARLVESQAQQVELEQRRKLVSIVIAGAIALLIVWQFKIAILTSLGVPQVARAWDYLFTAVVLIAGSDQIRELIKGGASAHTTAPAPEPIHVTGSLILREEGGSSKGARTVI